MEEITKAIVKEYGKTDSCNGLIQIRMLNWLQVLLTFVESKAANPITFIISISSSVLSSKSSSVFCSSLLFVSFCSSSLFSFSREGEGDVDLCRLGDLIFNK